MLWSGTKTYPEERPALSLAWGASVFKIDFAKLFPAAYGGPAEENTVPVVEKEASVVQNEINTELTVKNTPYHKHVVKARNDAYV